jgi:hypothetical protein
MRRASPAIRCYANGSCVNTATSNANVAAVRIGCSRLHNDINDSMPTAPRWVVEFPENRVTEAEPQLTFLVVATE